MNGTIVKKQKHRLQILVQELRNDMILLITQGFFSWKNCGWKCTSWGYLSQKLHSKLHKTNDKHT